MKKRIFSLILAVTLLLVTTTIAIADMPDNIAPAETSEPEWCSYGIGGSWFEGTFTWHYSNGATGMATYKCKMTELVFGEPQYATLEDYYMSSTYLCNGGPGILNYEFDGEKAMLIVQCAGLWSD